MLVQVVLIWLWIVLHRRRLRDAGRPTGIAIGIAMIYALEVVLLTLLIWIVMSGRRRPATRRAAPASFTCSSSFICWAMMTGDPNLGGLQIWLIGFARADVAAGR